MFAVSCVFEARRGAAAVRRGRGGERKAFSSRLVIVGDIYAEAGGIHPRAEPIRRQGSGWAASVIHSTWPQYRRKKKTRKKRWSPCTSSNMSVAPLIASRGLGLWRTSLLAALAGRDAGVPSDGSCESGRPCACPYTLSWAPQHHPLSHVAPPWTQKPHAAIALPPCALPAAPVCAHVVIDL